MLAALRAETVETWFDLGLSIDRLREDRTVPSASAPTQFEAFRSELERGIAFLAFDYGIDGVSMEIAKYAQAIGKLLPNARIHYIAGAFNEQADSVIDANAQWHPVEAMQGFGDWPLYRHFFSRRLERGGPLYNELIGRYWSATLELCERLGGIIEDHDIRLLWLVNVNSNPGNPALALAAALVSEHMGVPVVNNCHDFYWEEGAGEIARELSAAPRGPRDHFFTNAGVGEVFSIIETLYPWESRSWLTLCINRSQRDTLCERVGLNPASVQEVGTAVDLERFAPLDRRRTKETWQQLEEILRGGRSRVAAMAADQALDEAPAAGERRRPLLIARRRQARVDLSSDNSVLLQPTRVLSRKKIELNFKLIARLFATPPFAAAFSEPSKKLTLIVSGPVASGHRGYLERLIREFQKLVDALDPEVRDRVYLAFLFSAFDDSEFRLGYAHPMGMPELYNLASLVVLPSETEGRGLPLLEASACGTPILTRRYEPGEVFSAVVGEHLASDDRLELNAFSGSRPDDASVSRAAEQILDTRSREQARDHNRRVVERRYSMKVLTRDVDGALRQLFLQLQPGDPSATRARAALDAFGAGLAAAPDETAALLGHGREYLAGYGRMGFMLMLKSLIDPSYFRIEEQRLRGMAFAFARRLMQRCKAGAAERAEFYNSVEALFLCRDGELPIRIDHSLSYRHRNRRRYPYRELTPQELSGVIAMLHRELMGSQKSAGVKREATHQVAGWERMVARCCGAELAIDDRERLWKRLHENVPIALFPGPSTEHELEVFAVQTVRMRLGLGIHDELDPRALDGQPELAPITIIERREALPGGVDAETLKEYLATEADRELALLYERGICRVIASEQLSLGIDFRQLGREALCALLELRDAGGFVIALCEQAAMTTDGVGLERYHIGRADDPLSANILGIPEGSGYVQWAPAGLRSTLAYPTPTQTARSLGDTLRGRRFRRLCGRLGETAVLDALQADAEQRGSRAEEVLARLGAARGSRGSRIEHEALNGRYADGSPWSGAIARVAPSKSPFHYAILTATGGNQTVPEFVRRFNRSSSRRARIAWNGGYILNAELVGKLGLPESYIGSPLGLIVSKGKLLSPPLFNKPAFVVAADRSLAIRRVSCAGGLVAKGLGGAVEFGPDTRNLAHPGEAPCYYDLLFPGESLPGDGRCLLRLVGNRIMEVCETGAGEQLPVLPVGLVLSLPAGQRPRDWEVGRALSLQVAGLEDVAHAVEAGPLLLAHGEVCIDMELEGWKTRNSILTQAARLDYLDMRGPKIAIGLDAEGCLAVLAVNGRIRESVGATHVEMAEILEARGMQSAMGFDPGGSATLVVGEETLNISPYNRDYKRNVYSLPPQPRAVANAVVGY